MDRAQSRWGNTTFSYVQRRSRGSRQCAQGSTWHVLSVSSNTFLTITFGGFYVRDPRLFTCETGGLSMWGWGRHFSRAGETVARSTDTRRTGCSGVSAPLKDGATIFGNQAATVPPFSPNGTVSMISMIHLSVVQQGKPTHPSPSARQF
jgi:hypothetical protein